MRRYRIQAALSLAVILGISALVLLVFWPAAPLVEDAQPVTPPKPATPVPDRERPAAAPALPDAAKVVAAPTLTPSTWHEIAAAVTTSLDDFDSIACDSQVWVDLRTVDPPVSFLLPALVSKDRITFIAPPSQLLSLTRRGGSEVVAELVATDDGCVVRDPLRYWLRGKVVMSDNSRASTLPLRICGGHATADERHYSAWVAPNLAMTPRACTVEADGYVVRPQYLLVPQVEGVTLFVARRTHDDVVEEADQLIDLLDEMDDDQAAQAQGRAIQAAFLRDLADSAELSAEAAAWVRWKAQALASGVREDWQREVENQALEGLDEE